MTTKAEKLNKLIANIEGACPRGREGIRKLVAEITGEILEEKPTPTHRVGDRFSYRGAEYILAVASNTDLGNNKQVVAINLANGQRRGGESTPVKSFGAITEHELVRIFRTCLQSSIRKILPDTDRFSNIAQGCSGRRPDDEVPF